MFTFLRNDPTAFPCDCPLLHSCQQCTQEGSISPHPPCLSFCCFLKIIAIIVVVKWCVIVILICISLLNVEHVFMQLLVIGICYLAGGRMSIHVLCPFLNWVIFVLLLSLNSPLYIMNIILYLICNLKVCLPSVVVYSLS